MTDKHPLNCARRPSELMATYRRRAVRVSVVGVALTLLGLLGSFSGVASGAPADVASIPSLLRKYEPGSAEWASSPWMTSASCKDEGGDFSLWVANAIADIPQLVPVFYSQIFAETGTDQDRLRNWEIYKGFQQLSAEFRDAVPGGYCVDDMKRWAGADSRYKPFGFAWGVDNRTPYTCTDTSPEGHRQDSDNRWIGAERIMCDGFTVACANVETADQSRCAAWNEFSRWFTRRGEELRGAALNRYPGRGVATYHREVAWGWVILAALVGVAALAVLGVLIIRRRREATAPPVGGAHVHA